MEVNFLDTLAASIVAPVEQPPQPVQEHNQQDVDPFDDQRAGPGATGEKTCDPTKKPLDCWQKCSLDAKIKDCECKEQLQKVKDEFEKAGCKLVGCRIIPQNKSCRRGRR